MLSQTLMNNKYVPYSTSSNCWSKTDLIPAQKPKLVQKPVDPVRPVCSFVVRLKTLGESDFARFSDGGL